MHKFARITGQLYRLLIWVLFTAAAANLAFHPRSVDDAITFGIGAVGALLVQLVELTQAVKKVNFQARTVINAPDAQVIREVR